MGIKLNSNGKYSVTYHKRHPITRKPMSLKRKNVATKAQAERVLRELVVRIEDQIRKKVMPTWKSFLDEYFEYALSSGLSKTTIYNREKVLKFHTLGTWGNIYLDEITTPQIYQLISDRFAGYSEAHKKYFVKCIRGVFLYALERGFVGRNPTPLIKFKVNDKIKAVLSEDQIIHLLRRAQDQDWSWYPHYAAAVFTGLRNGELYALTWDKISLDTRQILVNCSWSSKDGYKSTKSGDDRIVEIPKPLLPVLTELKLKSGGSDFVLPRLSKWDKGEQARELRLFLKSVGLPEIRFHDLRASWATLLLCKGVPPSKVMSMGGWKNMGTMMIYMRKAGIDIKDSTSVLDEIKTHGVEAGKVIQFS